MYAGENRRNAWWVRLIAAGAGAALYTQNETAGYLVGGLGFLYSVRIDLRAARYERNAGLLFQSGYRLDNRYELVPDSIDQQPPRRIVPKSWRP